MKNIISWTNPNDAFRKRLRSRLKHVLRPLLRAQRTAKTRRENEKRFAVLSQNERLSAILQKGRALLYARGYRKSTPSPHMNYGRDPHYGQLHKKVGGKYFQVHLLARPAVNKTALQWLHVYWWDIPRWQQEQLKRIESLCVVAAIKGARPATLTALLPSWAPSAENIFTKNDMAGLHDDIPHLLTVAFIDGVKSIEDFANRFRSMIDTYNEANKSIQPTS